MDDTRITVMEAIAHKRTLIARYNGGELKLAPHLLFERRGDLFLSALNLSKTWRSEEEPRLGQFKLAGLVEASLVDEPFEPLPTYQPGPPRHGDVLVLAI